MYETVATVLQREPGGPELCLGGIMTSYPPQCGGPPIVDWDWEYVSGEERASDVTWGDYYLTGHYDGERFQVLRVASSTGMAAGSIRSAPTPAPSRDLSWRRLRQIQHYLSGVSAAKRYGYTLLWSDRDRDGGTVELGVDRSSSDTRRALARRYGKGVVRLEPRLHPVRRA